MRSHERGRRSELPVVRSLSIGYIELWRGVPLLTVLFMSTVVMPLFLPEGVSVDRLFLARIVARGRLPECCLVPRRGFEASFLLAPRFPGPPTAQSLLSKGIFFIGSVRRLVGPRAGSRLAGPPR